MAGRTAATGQTLSAASCERVLGDPAARDNWVSGIQLARSEDPPMAVLPDYATVADDRERAAAELDRSASLGKIHWRAEGSHHPDLRVCPSHLIAKEDWVRAARDWSNALYPLNAVSVNPPVQYGTMGVFWVCCRPVRL